MAGLFAAAVPALISGAASIGGGIISAQGAANANQQNTNNALQINSQQIAEQDKINNEQIAFQTQANLNNDYQAKLNRDWETSMSNTAYQRSMADMRAAGLNPILAYQQGGASTPSSGIATNQGVNLQAAKLNVPPPVQNSQAELGRAIGNAVPTALEAYKTTFAVEAAKAQAEKDSSGAALNRALEFKTTGVDTDKGRAEIYKINNDAALTREQALNEAIKSGIFKSGVTSAQGEARIKTREAEDAERWGSGPWAQRTGTIERGARRIWDAIINAPKPTYRQNW